MARVASLFALLLALCCEPWAVQSQCPPPGFDSVQSAHRSSVKLITSSKAERSPTDFNLSRYYGVWYIQQQAPNSYQPKDGALLLPKAGRQRVEHATHPIPQPCFACAPSTMLLLCLDALWCSTRRAMGPRQAQR